MTADTQAYLLCLPLVNIPVIPIYLYIRCIDTTNINSHFKTTT